MGRAPCCEKTGLKKGPWTEEEDQKLLAYIQKHGYGNWRTLPKNAGLQRCGKSCRLRWTNYLRPDIKRGRFSFEEEETIVQLHSILGNKWSAIAARLPGRTDNEIKNYWNTHIRKKLMRMGIDPVTHHPRLDLLLNLNPTLYCSSQIPDLNLLGFQHPNLMNPRLLRSLACFLNSPPNSGNVPLHQSQLINNNNNYVDQSLPELIQPSSNFASNLSQTDCQLMQQNNVGSLLENLSDGSELLPTLSELGFVDEPYYGGNGSGQAGVDPSSSPEALNIPNFGCRSSLMSTPSSNSTYNVNSCSELDERESYYCSNSSMLKLEMPDIWDVSYLM